MENLSVSAADWFLRPATQAVFASLNGEGFETRAVGGAVRNALLGSGPVSEVDFATTALPDEVMRLAADAGIKTYPSGIEHGTVTLVVDGNPFEVTTLRRDVSTDGRHAVVAFGNDWALDARRRDLTINALYADINGRVHDPLGSLDDLRAGRVRFIGDPHERIREDYLRILRFFRFSAGYAVGEFDREGIKAAVQERLGLLQLSRERIRMELLRILVTRRASEAIEIMDESGLLLLLLGGVSRRARFDQLCRIEEALNLVPDPIFRLGSLCLFVEEDAARITERLRLSSREASDLESLSALGPRITAHLERQALEECLYRIGPRLYLGRLLLTWAGSRDSPEDPHWRSALELARHRQRPLFPVGGADLIALGWEPSPGLGAALKKLEGLWVEGGFAASKEELLNIAASWQNSKAITNHGE
ncbi:MAG: CCA tRNA nucleotidyltransferase [Rhodomicrobium sp.]